MAKITGPILAINGLADTTVTPDNADQIVAASKNENSRTYFIENCDHTFNVFSGDDTALTDAIYAGIGFLENTFNGGIGARRHQREQVRQRHHQYPRLSVCRRPVLSWATF